MLKEAEAGRSLILRSAGLVLVFALYVSISVVLPPTAVSHSALPAVPSPPPTVLRALQKTTGFLQASGVGA